MTMASERLRVLFAAPAYWPAEAFGGPIPVMRSLAAELVESGHAVDVVTTALTTVAGPRSYWTRAEELDGSTIIYAATPFNYRWMGITPTLPLRLNRMPRPDVVHVFGFRDPVGTLVAAWCRLRGIPYAFEALGMFKPKLRKTGLKRGLDATFFRHVPLNATRLIACSGIEREEYVASGVSAERITVRPNGFPAGVDQAQRGALRSRLGLEAGVPLILAVGRVADGKGLDLLVQAMTTLEAVHLAIVGPDDGHGTTGRLIRQIAALGVGDRVHLAGRFEHADVLEAYADADIVALASAHENFGMVAAEAAAAGKAILLTDRCGIAELLGPHGALVVPYASDAVRAGLDQLLAQPGLRDELGRGAAATARTWSWQSVGRLQEVVYRQILTVEQRRTGETA